MCSLNFHSHPEKKNQNVLQKTLRNIIKFHNDSRTIVHPPPRKILMKTFSWGGKLFWVNASGDVQHRGTNDQVVPSCGLKVIT